MATIRNASTNCGGYGVVEMNHVASVKTGQIYAQLPLDGTTDFASAPAENGMLLVYDEITGVVRKPDAITEYVYLHKSVEKMYSSETVGLKEFALAKATTYPRLYKLNVGDTFTTTAFSYADSTYANVAAIQAAITTSVVYGICSTTGDIAIVATAGGTELVVLKAIKTTTLPDGTTGIKFRVVKA